MTNPRWIELSDFTPGVFGDYHAGITVSQSGGVLRNGAATLQNTYRCCADPNGGLSPLPGRNLAPSSDFPARAKTSMSPFAGSASANYLSGYQAMYLLDAVVIGGSPLETMTSETQSVADIYTLWSAIVSTAGTNPYQQMVLGRVFYHGASGNKDYVWETNGTVAGATSYTNAGPNYPLYGGNLCLFKSTNVASGTPPISAGSLMMGIAGAIGMRIYHATIPTAIAAGELGYTTYDTDTSYGLGVFGNYPSSVNTLGATSGFVFTHPDPTNASAMSILPLLNSGTTGYNPTTYNPVGARLVVSHQGRLVTNCAFPIAMPNSSTFGTNLTWYSQPLDIKAQVYTAGPAIDQFVEAHEEVDVMASVEVDQLLLIKSYNGATLVRGDLDNPTVVQLPYVESTCDVSSTPVKTPLGLVYGSRNGVFLWAGGERSQKLSNQIEGYFFKPNTENINGHYMRFGYFHPWVCVPNNFLYDIRTNSWWVLDSPSTYAYSVYVPDPQTGAMYAFPYKIAVGSTQYACDYFDPRYLATSFSWQSQPLIESRDRLLNVQEIEVMASTGQNTAAGQTVSVTISGYDYAGNPITPVTETFTMNGSSPSGPQPRIFRNDIHQQVQARHIQVRIQSNGNGSTAPKVYSVRLLAQDAAMPKKAAS